MRISNTFDLKIIQAEWKMQQVPAEITINQENAKMQLDYKENRASIGYQDSLAFQISFSQEALTTLQQGIDRRVQEGEMLKVEKHIKISEIARQKEEKPIKYPVLMYIEPVQIHVERIMPKVSVKLGGVSIQFSPGAVKVPTQSKVDTRA